jgi:hypothetical protein
LGACGEVRGYNYGKRKKIMEMRLKCLKGVEKGYNKIKKWHSH